MLSQLTLYLGIVLGLNIGLFLVAYRFSLYLRKLEKSGELKTEKAQTDPTKKRNSLAERSSVSAR